MNGARITARVRRDRLSDGARDGLVARGARTRQRALAAYRLWKALAKREGQIFGDWRIEGAECRDDYGRPRNAFRLAHADA